MVGGARLVRISGEINEGFDPRSITSGPAAAIVVFDLDQLVRVTSYGLSQWVLALEGLGAEYYCFVKVRPAIVDQFNMVRAFSQRGELVSLHAPFRCPACDQVTHLLIDLRRDFEMLETFDLPGVLCAGCQKPAEFDELPDQFFRYARSMPRPQPPAGAIAVIDGKPIAEARRFQIQKDVVGLVTAFWVSGELDERRYFRRAADGVDGLVVVEMSAVQQATDAGLAALAEFLGELSQGAVLARVGVPMIEPLLRMFHRHRLPEAVRLVSVSLPFRCHSCRRSLRIEMEGHEVRALAAGVDAPRCTTCRSALEATVPWPILEQTVRLPFGLTPEPIEQYLRTHPDLSDGGGDALQTALANPRSLLAGKYQVLRVLGEGGMGEVFLVRQFGPEGFTKKLVLKRVKRDRVEDRSFAQMFLEEARISARLSHPNAVQVLGLERLGTEYFMVMEYVDGIDLRRAFVNSIRAGMVWPEQVACRVVADICAGLHAAHTLLDEAGRPAPIVHRDISPDNVLVSSQGEVKVADFGIASGKRARGKGDFEGKPAYSAPELLLGLPTDHRVDVFAAGVILFEALTLRRFRPDHRQEAIARAYAPAPRISLHRPEVPPRLEEIYLHAVEAKPDDRYQTAGELGRDLEAVIRDLDDRNRTDYVAFIARVVALANELDATFSSGRSEVLQWTVEGPSEAVTQPSKVKRRRRRRDT